MEVSSLKLAINPIPPHRFEHFVFTTIAYCDLCHQVLWGLVKQGQYLLCARSIQVFALFMDDHHRSPFTFDSSVDFTRKLSDGLVKIGARFFEEITIFYDNRRCISHVIF